MKVLISGGGVARLTLAFWLRRSGATPVIVERSSEIRSGRFGIDLVGTAHDVITRMGLADRVEAHQIPNDSFAFVDGAGRRFGRLDRRLLQLAVRGPHTPVLHGDLEQILTDAVSPERQARALARTIIPSTQRGLRTQELLTKAIPDAVLVGMLRHRFGVGSILPPATAPASNQ